MANENENVERKLYRSQVHRMIGGVCGGLAEYFSIDPTVVRVLWLLASFFSGFGILAYLIFLILVPNNPEQAQVPREQRSKTENAGLIVGIALVVLGLMFLVDNTFGYFWVWDWPWFNFYPFRWSLVWPVLLILFGVWYIWQAQYKEKQKSGGQDAEAAGTTAAVKEFRRSKSVRMIAGVCGGLARYWNVDVSLIRVGAVLLTLMTNVWLGVLAYVLVVITIPEE